MEQTPFSAMSTSYAVFKVTYTGQPRDHQAIFIADEDENAGHMYHVVGSIQQGMNHELGRPTIAPEESMTFKGKTQIGCTAAANLQLFEDICRSKQVSHLLLPLPYQTLCPC